MKHFFIDNGKKPDEPYNAVLGFWLPPSTPFGNFQLKHMKIILRIDEANRHIKDCYHSWQKYFDNITRILPINDIERHFYSMEIAIYMMRKAADELISLICCLHYFKANHKYPSKLKIDSIGSLLKIDNNKQLDLFKPNNTLLQLLNDISNAFKHSFINSDQTLIGAKEPIIYALSLQRNNSNKKPLFYEVSLSDFIRNYNHFYSNCNEWLKNYSEKYRNK